MKDVYQATRAVFDVDLGLKDLCSGSDIVRPFDLTAALLPTSKICWRAGATVITKAFDDPDVAIIGDPRDGLVQGILDTAETDSFSGGEIGDLEIEIDKGSGDITKFQVIGGFQIIQKICA